MAPFREYKKCNLMLLGASGVIANAFLCHLGTYRRLFGKLILVDKSDKVLNNIYIDHKSLDYEFVNKKIILPDMEKEYKDLLEKYEIDIVLDITDMDTLPILQATDSVGVSYICTSLNESNADLADTFSKFFQMKKNINHAAHIIDTGMNPGIVNMWVRYGIEKHGIPKEIIHFEYDTSSIAKEWQPMMTWSINQFLVESVICPGGVVLGRGNVKKLLPCALEHRVNMKPILSPIMKLDKYPWGLTVLHDENITIAEKYDIPSKFIYAVNQQTMESLVKIYQEKKTVSKTDLKLGDNTTNVLDGSDNIGVLLNYEDNMVYYFNSIHNDSMIGTNATSTQVSLGIFAALFTLMIDDLPKGTHFVEDIYDSHFKYYLFDNMRVQELVFKKTADGSELIKHEPMIKMKRMGRFEHLYVL